MEVSFLCTQPYFPEHNEDGIDTIQFLKASRGLVWLIDQFGFGFELVKNDLNGNIEKLLQKYHENTIEHGCLMKMVLKEHRDGEGEKSAIESLLWLRRGLKLMAEFLSGFLENETTEKRDENLTKVLCVAYEKSLKPHHNFAIRLLFNMLCTRCPKRKDFLTILGYHHVNDEERFRSLLHNYLHNLQSNLNLLVLFFKNNNIKPHH